MISLRDDAWFSGFAAGEGSFLIARRNQHGLAPCFVIGLRADDLEILETLSVGFGGAIHMSPARGNDKPGAYWTVSSKREMAGLVAYFDRFPLRAKKARDYTIWRRAVQAYCVGGQRAPELPSLKEALQAGRRFTLVESDEPVADESLQLRLVS